MQKKTEKTTALKRLMDSRLLWAVVSVLLSLLIWIYYGENYGTEITQTFSGVEVTYVGEEAMRESQNLIVSNEETTSVTVTLTGSRRDIARLSAEELRAVVNLSAVTSAGYRTMAYTITYPSGVNSASIREDLKTPQTVGLQISKVATRVKDVCGRFEGTLQEGYVLDSAGIGFEPEYITLIGPEEELDEIECAYVIVDREDVSASFTAKANYNLVDAEGEILAFDDVTADVETVDVTVPVNKTKEVGLDVNLVYGGGVGEDNVIREIEPSTITIAGDAATIDAVNTLYLATIDLSDYLAFPATDYTIVLPNDTDNLSGVTTATVRLTFTGLETELYTVTNLEYTGLEDGYDANVMVDSVVVTIRAPEGVIDQISPNNIRIVADLTGVTTTTRAPTTVYVDGFAEAGAVGDYPLYVRVSPHVGTASAGRLEAGT